MKIERDLRKNVILSFAIIKRLNFHLRVFNFSPMIQNILVKSNMIMTMMKKIKMREKMIITLGIIILAKNHYMMR